MDLIKPLSSKCLLNELYLMIVNNDLDKLEQSLESIKQIDEIQLVNGQTPLSCAIQLGSTDIGSILIEERIGINQVNIDQLAPIHVAIRYERTELIEKLLACPDLDVNMNAGPPYYTPIQQIFNSFRDYSTLDSLLRQLVSHPNFRMPKKFSLIPLWIIREKRVPLRSSIHTINYLLNIGFPLFGSRKPPKKSQFSDEIEKFISALLINPWVSFLAIVRQAENSYGRRFPNLYRLINEQSENRWTPLSLKQLCRVTIRNQWTNSNRVIIRSRLRYQLAYCLPRTLIDYICDITINK